MTQTPPRLTDRATLDRQRARATRRAAAAGAPAAPMFLHQEAATEIEERLAAVNRDFTAPALVTGHPGFWAPRFPAARCVGDTETLDLAAGAHDLVIHAMALHWADDPVGQLVQCRRALAPDGLFLGLGFGGRSLQELRASLAQAEIELTGGLSPRVAPMAEIRDLGGLLQRAGYALPVADSLLLPASYASALHLMQELRAMGEGNALAARRRQFTRRALFAAAAGHYAAHFASEGTRVTATFEIITLTGWAPGPGQQQPLRPGSAKSRLASALGTKERRLDGMAAKLTSPGLRLSRPTSRMTSRGQSAYAGREF